jgi:hypothetical protein
MLKLNFEFDGVAYDEQPHHLVDLLSDKDLSDVDREMINKGFELGYYRLTICVHAIVPYRLWRVPKGRALVFVIGGGGNGYALVSC